MNKEKSMSRELILITVSGPDNPGITAGLTQVISEQGYSIVDMGQSVTHGLLSLSILVNMDSDRGSKLLKELLFKAKKLRIHLDFEMVESDLLSSDPQAKKFVISSVHSEQLPSAYINALAEHLAKEQINILRIDNNSYNKFNALDVVATTQGKMNWDKLKKDLVQVAHHYQTDIAFVKDDAFRYNKRLIVFDMDSTLIQAEVIDEIAKYCGVGKKVSEITELAMEGQIDFDQALQQRVQLLEGLDILELQKIADSLPLTPGVESVIKTLKALGFKVALISGGFQFFAQYFKQKLGLDYAFANQLEVQEGKLTGRVEGSIVNAAQKATLLDLIAQQESISLEQVVAVGDGANDLPMLAKAGMGIAFHAKAIVREKAQQQLSNGPMTNILYFLGIPGEFVQKQN